MPMSEGDRGRRATGGRSGVDRCRNTSGSRSRAQSTPLDYTLSLGIAALVVAGLVTAAGGFVEDRRESVVRTELAVVGEQLAGELVAVDRLAQMGDSTEALTVTKPLPATVAGEAYHVETETRGDTQWLNLTAPGPGVSVSVRYETTTAVVDESVQGGTIEITYDPGTDRLEVRS